MSTVRSLPQRTTVADLFVLTYTISVALVARLARAAGNQHATAKAQGLALGSTAADAVSPSTGIASSNTKMRP